MGASLKRLSCRRFFFLFWGKQKPNQRRGLQGKKIPPSQRWEGGKMAALASSLIRQKRAVKDDQANRPVANKRKPCPKNNKSLCQKQILVLISKVRLCGGRKGRNDKRPGESRLPFFFIFSCSYVELFDHKWNVKISRSKLRSHLHITQLNKSSNFLYCVNFCGCNCN